MGTMSPPPESESSDEAALLLAELPPPQGNGEDALHAWVPALQALPLRDGQVLSELLYFGYVQGKLRGVLPETSALTELRALGRVLRDLPDELLHEMACDFAQRFGLPGLPTLLPGQCPEPDLQRAACVRAFMGRPELVILEHPLEFADAGLLPPLVDAIQQVRRRQGSVIWFTRRRAVLEDHGIPADHRYRIAGRQLLELETSA